MKTKTMGIAGLAALALAALGIGRIAGQEATVKNPGNRLAVVNEVVNERARYTPSVFAVEKGKEIVLVLNNLDKTKKHGFSIDELKIQETMQPGQTGKEVKIRGKKAGVFTVYCQYHAAHLPGQLIVVP